MVIGMGTVVNVVAVVIGTLVGLVLGHRLPQRSRDLVTQVLGLITLVIGGMSVAAGMSDAFAAEVGADARLLVVLGALLFGGLAGSALRVEQRLDDGAEWLRERFAGRSDESTFVEGAVTATLVFCVGPLSILGSLSDGLGQGAEQLLVKSVMDGFAAIAFASSLGIGVMVAALAVAVYQGSLTLLGMAVGNFLPAGHIDALTAAGGIILLGLGFRLAGIKAIPVGDLLPALVAAPVLVALVGLVR